MKNTEKVKIFSQAIATTSLIAELFNTNFLESNYYKTKINFQSDDVIIRNVLGQSGIGNPATLQMFFYALLVVPKELLKKPIGNSISTWDESINKLFFKVGCEIETSYKGEDPRVKSTINFYKHMRNAIAHSNCDYKTENGISYVTFKDKMGESQKWQMTMTTANAGMVLTQLVKLMKVYLNKQSVSRVICDNNDMTPEYKSKLISELMRQQQATRLYHEESHRQYEEVHRQNEELLKRLDKILEYQKHNVVLVNLVAKMQTQLADYEAERKRNNK